jgi:hypothetical protein
MALSGRSVTARPSYHRNEFISDALPQFYREFLTIRIYNAFLTKVQDRRKTGKREHPKEVSHKGNILPPANHRAGGRLIAWCPVGDRSVRNGKIGPRSKFEKL